MEKTVINPSTITAPVGAYSHAFKVGNTLYIAGQVGAGKDGKMVKPGDVKAQGRQAYENIKAILNAAGGNWANVVRFTTYLTREEDLPAFRELREELFKKYFPDGVYPPNTLLVIKGLYSKEVVIEIEATAVL